MNPFDFGLGIDGPLIGGFATGWVIALKYRESNVGLALLVALLSLVVWLTYIGALIIFDVALSAPSFEFSLKSAFLAAFSFIIVLLLLLLAGAMYVLWSGLFAFPGVFVGNLASNRGRFSPNVHAVAAIFAIAAFLLALSVALAPLTRGWADDSGLSFLLSPWTARFIRIGGALAVGILAIGVGKILLIFEDRDRYLGYALVVGIIPLVLSLPTIVLISQPHPESYLVVSHPTASSIAPMFVSASVLLSSITFFALRFRNHASTKILEGQPSE